MTVLGMCLHAIVITGLIDVLSDRNMYCAQNEFVLPLSLHNVL
jgi:hypothetical protein